MTEFLKATNRFLDAYAVNKDWQSELDLLLRQYSKYRNIGKKVRVATETEDLRNGYEALRDAYYMFEVIARNA
jgi:hypothetical protein